MEILNRKLSLLKGKVENSQPITIMIIGLGSVGCYLLDYLVSLGDSQLRLVVVGRNAEKMQMNIVGRRLMIYRNMEWMFLQSVQIGKAILTISMSSVKSFTFLALRVSHLLCFARSVLLLILALLVLAVLLHVLFQSRKM